MPHVYVEKRPASSKAKQNGFAPTEDMQKSPIVTNKRLHEKISSSDQSLVKKPKVCDTASGPKAKQSVKAEPDDDDHDHDHIPIALRLKKPESAGNKSYSGKEKIKKVVSFYHKKKRKECYFNKI